MNILVIGFDWNGLAQRDPAALLRKLARDHIDAAGANLLLWEFAPAAGDMPIARNVRAVNRRGRCRRLRPIYDFLAPGLLMRDLRRIRFVPDAVVLYDFPLLPAAARVRRRFAARTVFYLTNLPANLAKTRRAGVLKSAYHRWFERRAAATVDAFVAINETTRAYAESLGVPPGRISIFPPDTIRPDRASIAAAKKGALRARFGIPAAAHLLLSIGRLEPEKGFDRLIRAFAALGRADAALVIAGQGRLEDSLRELARELGVASRVHFAGHVPRAEIWNYYADADAFVLLSRSEALGLVVWEAMYARVPVVASGAGGLAESIGADGERGFLWREEDGIAAMADRLDRCFDRAAAAPMLDRARAYVESTFGSADLAGVLGSLPPKLLYATSAAYPSTLANRLQTLSMAKEFYRLLGSRFLFGVSSFAAPRPELPIIEVPGARSVGIAFAYLARIRREHIDRLFCRESRLFFFLLLGIRLFGLPVRCFLELHAVQDAWWFWWEVRHADGIIVVADGIREYVQSKMRSPQRFLVAPGAVDIERFSGLPPRAEARRRLGLPEEATIVAYVGSFGFIAPWDYNPWKGADVLLEAAARLPSCLFVFAGGEPAEVEEVRRRYPENNIVLLGQRAAEDIPLILRAADVLALPNKSGYAVSERYTSPLKLFEYMASGTPIVASDLPSIREIIPDDACFFARPGDSVALAGAIRAAVEDPAGAERRSAAARALAERNTWRARAEAIRRFIS